MEFTELQMLELAAKAAGYKFAVGKDWYDVGEPQVDGKGWNPREDDGDSRRLEVKLGLQVTAGGIFIEVRKLGFPDILEATGDDPCEATRFAVLRAAAQIGYNMLTPDERKAMFPEHAEAA